MNKEKLIASLWALDGLLKGELEITVCGGCAGILIHDLERATMGIDVINSQPKLSEYSEAIQSLTDSLGYNENWMNDAAKGFIDYLPGGYSTRREKLDESFKYLTVYCIARIDYFIMKLVAGRIQDLQDIEHIQLNSPELKILEKAVKKILKFDSKTAHKLDLFIREYKLNG